MQPDFSQIGPVLAAALVVFVLYRRLSRSFGRQPLLPGRMTIRTVLLVVIACVMLPAAVRSATFMSALLAGASGGVALGYYGASHTRFLTHRERLYYVPHTYTGIAVSLLFLGRLVYRFLEMYVGPHAPGAVPGHEAAQVLAPHAMVQSPLTFGLLFVLVGYYVCFYSLVLYKSKHIKAEDIEVVPVPATPQP